MRVRVRNAAVVGGLIAAVYLAAVFSIRRVPDGLLEALGGPHGIEREGGLVVRYLPPEGVDAARLERSIALRRMTVRRDSGRLVLEVPEVKQADADDIVATLTRGGLAFYEVIDDLSLLKVPHDTVGHDQFVAPGVRVQYDAWITETGTRASSSFLSADRPSRLTRAFAQLRAAGWSPPPHTVIAYERIAWGAKFGAEREEWRSYFLGERVLLDGDAVANAVRSADPGTGRPVVLLEFDRAGAERFAEITARMVGHKLATVVGGVVRSAPVINSAIRGGRVLITLGGGDLDRQERNADALAPVLRLGALPPGGVIEDQRWYPPAPVSAPLVLAVLVIALAGGALVGGAVAIALRFTRPVWQPGMARRPGGLPVRRLAVTLLAPVVLIALGNVTLPGLNEVELHHILGRSGGGNLFQFSIVALGVRPILTAFVVVELAMLVVPRWRRVRLQPAARIASGRYVAILGLVFAVVQGHLVAGSLSVLSRDGSELFTPGAANELAATASLPAGTLLLVIVAGMIRQHGLGNGYGAVIASDWAIRAVRSILDGPMLDGPISGHALGLVTLAAIGAATVALLRMRIGGDGDAPLRVPASGSLPLTTSGLLAAPWLLAGSGRGGLWWFAGWIPDPSQLGWVLVAAVAVLVPVWSLALSRPAIVAPLAVRAAVAPPRWSGWRGATLVSLVFLVLIATASTLSMTTHPDAAVLSEAAGAMLFAAVVLDLVDDLRARRGDLVVVWPLHQAHHAELVRGVLADAGIPCHLASSHLRTLLAVFGPYAPIDVLVPAGSADAARSKIAELYHDVQVSAFD